jgi:protein involved in polysaccharide export with SLBB domain
VTSSPHRGATELHLMFRDLCRLILALVLCAALPACAENPASLEGYASPLADANPSQQSLSSGQEYRLGSGDRLRIIVFGEDNLSGEFVVDAIGAVDMPLVGKVQAQGSTVGEFQGRVVAQLQKGYLNDPKVSVEVLNYRPFFITGEVKSGGEFPYKAGLTVQDAVGVAGGYTYRANTGAAYIRRAGQDKEQKVELDQRVPISPGDSIRIPERIF